MGFVMRLNSRDLVNDPKNGAEVYPITATNAVFREGGENLEDILSRLGNQADRKVIQDLEYLSNTKTLRVTYTDNTTDNIQLSNFVSDVQITGAVVGTSIVTNGVAKIPDFPVNIKVTQDDYFMGASEGLVHHVSGDTALGNRVLSYGSVYPPRLVTHGSGNAITRLSYSLDSDDTKSNRLNLDISTDDFVTDVQIRGISVVNNNIANMDIVKNNNSIYAVQYVDSEQTYQSMTKDPNTLYFIPVE